MYLNKFKEYDDPVKVNLSPKIVKVRPFEKSTEFQTSFGTPLKAKAVATVTPIVSTTPTLAPSKFKITTPCMNCKCCEYIKTTQPLLLEAYQRQKRMSEKIARVKRL